MLVTIGHFLHIALCFTAIFKFTICAPIPRISSEESREMKILPFDYDDEANSQSAGTTGIIPTYEVSEMGISTDKSMGLNLVPSSYDDDKLQKRSMLLLYRTPTKDSSLNDSGTELKLTPSKETSKKSNMEQLEPLFIFLCFLGSVVVFYLLTVLLIYFVIPFLLNILPHEQIYNNGQYSFLDKILYCLLTILILILVIPTIPGLCIRSLFHHNNDTPVGQSPRPQNIKYPIPFEGEKVTRKQIDDSIPNFSSQDALKFNFLDPANSFNKRLTYKEVKELSYFEENFCLFCLDQYEDDSGMLYLPCGHYCHYDCLKLYSKVKPSINNSDSKKSARCPFCQLNLLRHYLFYKERDIDPEVVKFFNNET